MIITHTRSAASVYSRPACRPLSPPFNTRPDARAISFHKKNATDFCFYFFPFGINKKIKICIHKISKWTRKRERKRYMGDFFSFLCSQPLWLYRRNRNTGAGCNNLYGACTHSTRTGNDIYTEPIIINSTVPKISFHFLLFRQQSKCVNKIRERVVVINRKCFKRCKNNFSFRRAAEEGETVVNQIPNN